MPARRRPRRAIIDGAIGEVVPAIAAVVGKAEVRRLRIAPDGMLNLLPFAALQDGHGHYLAERFEISYTGAARDLAEAAGTAHTDAGPVIVAVSPEQTRRP